LSATLHVVEKVPPYVDVRLVAVATTPGSGAGSAITAELESTDIAIAVETEAAEAFPLKGVAAGVAMGLRSVVASTTI
jgi:hypothetical protein